MAEEQDVEAEVLADDTGIDEEPEDIDEADLADLGVDDDLLPEDEVTEEEGAAELVADGEESEAEEVDDEAAPVPAAGEDEDEEEDEEDEDDVEASLDVILKEKLVVADEEADEEPPDQEDRVESSVNRVLPKQPDEFVCTSCFLVKHPSQLADGERQLCRDCV